MFLAGEISAVVLHQDLDFFQKSDLLGLEDPDLTKVQAEVGSFSGWPVLRDLEGRKEDQEITQRIGNRFLTARLVRGWLEDDLVAAPESLSGQVAAVRMELDPFCVDHPEWAIWDRVLRSVAGTDFENLLSALLHWGKAVEGEGHLNGALEIFSMAYEIAQATGSSDGAADAARFRAKIFRTRAEWSRSLAWYDVARRISEESGNKRKLASVLDGLANAYRDKGNLPRAKEILSGVLEMGNRSGDRYALAIGHHDLMTVEKLSGDLLAAIRHGWLAVQSYESRDGSLRALFDLAGVLRERGELSAAWDAYSVVVNQVKGLEAKVLALDALAFVAALRGDRERHDGLRSRMDEEGWEEVSPVYRGQILYYRGLSSRALGEEAEARNWLTRALAFAEENGLSKLIFDAEEALRVTPRAPTETDEHTYPSGSAPEEILGVRQGLREMREALATTDVLT
jgi:tetratricopeptide (TPR) repeat protein